MPGTMNPVLYGLYRKQQAEAARRAALIQMQIAADTGYVNPQLNTAYLTGAYGYVPSTREGLPMTQVQAGSSRSIPVIQNAPVEEGLAPADQALTDAVLTTIPQAQLSAQQAEVLAEINRQKLINLQIADTRRAMLNATTPPRQMTEEEVRAQQIRNAMNYQLAQDYIKSQTQYLS